jgi:hypothetical protein
LNGNPKFPGGTLRMQLPFFAALGLDLSAFYPGTLNVSIAPLSYRVWQAETTRFVDLKWHPEDPAEDFSFFDVVVHRENGPPVRGWIYFPHPDTKPTHFQKPMCWNCCCHGPKDSTTARNSGSMCLLSRWPSH